MRLLMLIAVIVALPTSGFGQAPAPDHAAELDKKVRAFLERHRGSWRDLNVPESDGRVLHNLVLKHKYTRALEIGTSTGHSGVWIAWALAKTGGKLITVEVDPQRHQTALANFKEAGLASYIDARLGDAHEIVPAFPGPFDFVFSDADKDWYKLFRRRMAEARSRRLLYSAQRVQSHSSAFLDFLWHGRRHRGISGAFEDAARRGNDDRYFQ